MYTNIWDTCFSLKLSYAHIVLSVFFVNNRTRSHDKLLLLAVTGRVTLVWQHSSAKCKGTSDSQTPKP